MIIRPVEFNELKIIQRLAHEIWPIVYREMITRKQIDYMLEWMYSMSSLEQQFKEGCYFFVASDQENHPIGFSSYSLMENDSDSFAAFKLHKLYVQAHLHGKGIGKSLLGHIISLLKKTGDCKLMLNVNRNNKAVAFYRKMGFTILKEVDHDIGNGYYMNDYIMCKEIICDLHY